MKRKFLLVLTAALPLFLCTEKQTGPNGVPVLRVGTQLYSKQDYRDFERMKYVYPVVRRDNVFPATKDVPTLLIETIALHPQSRPFAGGFRKSTEYIWRKTFFTGNLYQKSVIIQNLGFTERQLKRYYDNRRKKSPGVFSAPSFELAQQAVAESLFLQTYPPDSAYRKYFSQRDPLALNKIWLTDIKKDPAEFFRKRYYSQKHQKSYPNAPDAIIGEGKLVTDAEVDLVIDWLEESSRKERHSPAFRKRIANMMVGWKLFSEQASKSGFMRLPENRALLKWFEMYSSVDHYINTRLAPMAPAGGMPDSAMIALQFHDRVSATDTFPSPEYLHNYADSLQHFNRRAEVNRILFRLRDSLEVVFVDWELRDDLAPGPQKILAKADSLAENSLMELAEKQYRILINSFALYDEGKLAHRNLADLYMERRMYPQAIEQYRNYILTRPADSEITQSLLFIAHLYQQQGQLELARENLDFIIDTFPQSNHSSEAAALLRMLETGP